MRPNFHYVELDRITIWFSYETPIAFQVGGNPRVISENVWGKTTGKHLNSLDDGDRAAKALRLPRDAFTVAMGKVLGRLYDATEPKTETARTEALAGELQRIKDNVKEA